MMRALMLSLLVLLGTGCAALDIGPQKDNRTWFTATCSGASNWEDCKQQAARACRNGYDVANQEENAVTLKRTFQYACK